jgi:cell wall assembly regulator SMI1
MELRREVPKRYVALSMGEMWKRVEEWLRALPGTFADRLSGPASEGDIAALVEAAGGWLPDDYLASLRCHAGNAVNTTADSRRYPVDLITQIIWLAPELVIDERNWLVNNYAPFPTAQYTRFAATVRRAYYDPGWIPVACGDSDRALYYCVDTVPTEPAARGQVVAMMTNDSDREYVYASYRAWFACAVLERIDAGPPDPYDLAEGVIVLSDE